MRRSLPDPRSNGGRPQDSRGRGRTHQARSAPHGGGTWAGVATPASHGLRPLAAVTSAPAPQERSERSGNRRLASNAGPLLDLTSDRQELLCSMIGLAVKLGLVAVAGVSLVRLAMAYQQRMDRQGEIAAVLQIENAKLARARERFDQLFMVEGEQRLIREQSQWIAPNRLRVVWQAEGPLPTVETVNGSSGKAAGRP